MEFAFTSEKTSVTPSYGVDSGRGGPVGWVLGDAARKEKEHQVGYRWYGWGSNVNHQAWLKRKAL